MTKLSFDLSSNDAAILLRQLEKLTAAMTGQSVLGFLNDLGGLVARMSGFGAIKSTVTFAEGDSPVDYCPRLIELLGHENQEVFKTARKLLGAIEGSYPFLVATLLGMPYDHVQKSDVDLGKLLIEEALEEKDSAPLDRLLAAEELCMSSVLTRVSQDLRKKAADKRAAQQTSNGVDGGPIA